MRGASSTSDDWKVVYDEKLEVKEDKDKEVDLGTFIALKWTRLLKKYWGIRKLQCIFRGTGNYLNELVSKECRERLSRTYSLKK